MHFYRTKYQTLGTCFLLFYVLFDVYCTATARLRWRSLLCFTVIWKKKRRNFELFYAFITFMDMPRAVTPDQRIHCLQTEHGMKGPEGTLYFKGILSFVHLLPSLCVPFYHPYHLMLFFVCFSPFSHEAQEADTEKLKWYRLEECNTSQLTMFSLLKNLSCYRILLGMLLSVSCLEQLLDWRNSTF